MDPRFPVDSDPRFRRLKKRGRIVLDSRFSSILNPEFSEQPLLDRYGRRLKRQKRDRKTIEKLYILPDDFSNDSSGFSSKKKDSSKNNINHLNQEKDNIKADGDTHEGLVNHEDTFVNSDELSVLSKDDSSQDFSSSEDDLSLDIASDSLELVDPDPEPEIPRGNMTYRLAAVNLDWDHIRSIDIFAVLNSFTPKNGRILNVSIYPSEFGKKRMEEEDAKGPPRDIFATKSYSSTCIKDETQELKESEELDNDTDDTGSSIEDDTDDEEIRKSILKEDEGSDFNMTQLRKYQLERLRYYYAIIVCDSVDTAKYIYEQCDGREYEASANFFDLRFVPDEESFDSMQIRDECSSLPETYVPEEFVTDALKHSNVKLMWDNDDPVYTQLVKRAFSGKELNENDFKAYLASTDSETSDIETVKKKYRSLLLDNENGLLHDRSNVVGDMQVTFLTGLNEKASEETSVEDETTLEKYKRKERERRRRKNEKKRSVNENDLGHSEYEKNEIDLGFNDSFFSEKSNLSSKKIKHKTFLKKEDLNDREKASLELLTMEDRISGNNMIHHFDMKEILKMEKKKNKRKKKGKQINFEEVQDQFDIDVNDPRFSVIYSNHHFAIDPTNPRFKKTNSMMKIMEEHRRRTKTLE